MKILKLLFKAILIIINILKVFSTRQLEIIELSTNDERCNKAGVCFGLDYADRNVVARFKHKPQIHFTTNTTYEVAERKQYFALTFLNSKFHNFPLELFKAFHIMELDFRNCSLKTLTRNNFLNACPLKVLLLSDNRLTKLKAKQFSQAKNLTFLVINNNKIDNLHQQSFKGLKKLKYLDLHNNLIESLPEGIFGALKNLQQINLAENRLKIITEDLFASNPKLLSIQLQRNLINEIENYAFQKQYLKFLDISHNRELQVFVTTFLRADYLWASNCSLKRVNIYGKVSHLNFQHNLIKELYFSKPEFLESLILKDNDLEQLNTLAKAKHLKSLDVSHNPKLSSLNDLWQINSLERLDCSNITLKEIPTRIFFAANNLKYLNISYNQIQEIPPTIFKSFEKLSEFYLDHNKWSCYNLQMLMNTIIIPSNIYYTKDTYEKTSYTDPYIKGIKCYPRAQRTRKAFTIKESSSSHDLFTKNPQPFIALPHKLFNFDHFQNVQEFGKVLKSAVRKYEQTFDLIREKMDDLDERLTEFEIFNKNIQFWQRATIMV